MPHLVVSHRSRKDAASRPAPRRDCRRKGRSGRLAAPVPSRLRAPQGTCLRPTHTVFTMCQLAQVFGCVEMKDFLETLARRVKRNGNALDIFRRLYTPAPEVPASPDGSPLQTKVRCDAPAGHGAPHARQAAGLAGGAPGHAQQSKEPIPGTLAQQACRLVCLFHFSIGHPAVFSFIPALSGPLQAHPGAAAALHPAAGGNRGLGLQLPEAAAARWLPVSGACCWGWGDGGTQHETSRAARLLSSLPIAQATSVTFRHPAALRQVRVESAVRQHRVERGRHAGARSGRTGPAAPRPGVHR